MRKPVYANNKGADQPAHPRSLISTFVVRCLDSIMPLVSIFEISSLCLTSVAAQAGLCLTWSQTPKTGFLVTWLIRTVFHFWTKNERRKSDRSILSTAQLQLGGSKHLSVPVNLGLSIDFFKFTSMFILGKVKHC